MRRIAFVVAGMMLVSTPARSSGLNIDLITCQPDGMVARASEAIRGEGFWRSELENIREERNEIFKNRRLAIETNREFDKINREADKIIAETNAQLARSGVYLPPPSAADRLREVADMLEAKEMENFIWQLNEDRLKKLKRCEDAISARLRR